MTDRPKDWEILKALDEGREVTGLYPGSLGKVVSIDRAELYLRHAPYEFVVQGMIRTKWTDIQIAPPTTYTLEEAAAAIARGEKVLCDTSEQTELVLTGVALNGVVSAESDMGATICTFDATGFRPAPPEPSIEELMRAHDPVGNPTVELYFDKIGATKVPATRFLWASSHAQATFVNEADKFSAHIFNRDGTAYCDKPYTLRPITNEGRALLAEWAKGQQS